MIELWIEGHPETAHRPRLGRGRVYMDPKFQLWRQTIAWEAKVQVDKPMNGYVVLALHFFSDTWQKQDIDNLAKAVLDGLSGVLFHDDRQVANLHLFKSRPEDAEGVLIRAWSPIEFALEYEDAILELFSLVREKETDK